LPRKINCISKFDLTLLKDSEVTKIFQTSLIGSLIELKKETDPNPIFDAISKSILESSTATLSTKKMKSTSNWMSQHSKIAIDNKHKILKEHGPSCSIQSTKI